MIAPQFPDEGQSRVSERTLRQFAGLCLGIFGLMFATSLYRHHGVPNVPGWIALALALSIGIPGLIRPDWIRPVYLAGMAITRPIGHLTSLLMLGVVYYLFVTPLALIFRLARRDPLNRSGRNVASYWIPRVQPVDPRRYLRQYQRQQTESREEEDRLYGKSKLSSR